MARVNHPNFRELGWGDTLLYKLFGQKEWARKGLGVAGRNMPATPRSLHAGIR